MSAAPTTSRHAGPRGAEVDARERFHRAVADLAAEPSVAAVVRYLRASDGLAAAQAESATASSADGATL